MEGSAGQGNLSAGCRGGDTPPYPAWALTLLVLTLIVTMAGDILGNSLVTASVLKNKKLWKAAEALPQGNRRL